MSTAIIVPSGATKYSSLPSARHLGNCPPFVEIWNSPPLGGNGRTYTSNRAFWAMDWEAIHRPSGEKVALEVAHGTTTVWLGVAALEPQAFCAATLNTYVPGPTVPLTARPATGRFPVKLPETASM